MAPAVEAQIVLVPTKNKATREEEGEGEEGKNTR